MIFTYKLGKEYLNKSKIDKNSAVWEYEEIHRIAVEYPGKKNILLVVGGLANENDIENVQDMLNRKLNGKPYFDKTVFVMTDTGSLKYLGLIDRFDLLLHQAHIPIEKLNTKQTYGYMPELFYREKEEVHNKNNIVLFGGNNLNRNAELCKLCFMDGLHNNINDGLLLLLKDYNNGTDYRIDHEAYMSLLSQCKFSLVFSSDWIYKHGWITARLLEAFSVGNIPLVSNEYDATKWYKHEYTRVISYRDIQNALNGKRSIEIREELEYNKKLAESRKNKFKEILYNL